MRCMIILCLGLMMAGCATTGRNGELNKAEAQTAGALASTRENAKQSITYNIDFKGVTPDVAEKLSPGVITINTNQTISGPTTQEGAEISPGRAIEGNSVSPTP